MTKTTIPTTRMIEISKTAVSSLNRPKRSIGTISSQQVEAEDRVPQQEEHEAHSNQPREGHHWRRLGGAEVSTKPPINPTSNANGLAGYCLSSSMVTEAYFYSAGVRVGEPVLDSTADFHVRSMPAPGSGIGPRWNSPKKRQARQTRKFFFSADPVITPLQQHRQN